LSKDEKSIREWLKQLRENKAGAIETKVLSVGVTVSSIASLFSQQLNDYFDKHKRNYADFRRRDLASMIGTKALSTKSGPPTVSIWVRNRLKGYGISVSHRGGFVSFKRIKPKIYK
jgi:hypothetical protein